MPDQRRNRRSVVVPPSRRRRSALRRVVYSFIVLAGCIALAVFGIGLYGYTTFTKPGPLAADVTFQVPRGGVRDIAAELENAGIVSNAYVFTAAAQLTGDRGRLKPGEYHFKQAMSMRDVMALLVSGKIITHKVTIPEGWTTAQTLDRLRENTILTGDITVIPAEGQIMPDTYIFQRGETRDNLLRTMMRANQKVVDELWAKRAEDAPVKTPAEALILASIIEKETGVPEERPRVASVFANRLRLGMRLQSDPTIIYGITGGRKLDRPLTRRDIAQATPYNTYQIDGLPPGPIANPGRASIEAALAPARTADLYFVADGSGGHAFAATLDEHRVNVRKWRQIEKQRNQGGEEAPVMDEPSVAPDAAEASAGPAPETASNQTGGAPAEPAAADPTPDAGEQSEATAIPSVADLLMAEALKGEQASAETQSLQSGSALVPIPRPRPEGVGRFASGAPAETGPEAAPEATNNSSETTTLANVELDLKPGSVIRGSKGLIPIPAPKPTAP